VLLEILKIVASIIGGGLAGAIANEWFRTRSARVTPIPLIQRANRKMATELHGLVLARKKGDPSSPEFEQITDLREYQFTLRNTSKLNLQNVEIEFDFPATDIQAWVSRTAISKTALNPIDTSPAELNWKKFRWRIPHLPSGDSAEFTFQAVSPKSSMFHAALYGTDRVILETVEGEPAPLKQQPSWAHFAVGVMTGILAVMGYLWLPKDRVTTDKIISSGCEISITSRAEYLPPSSGDPTVEVIEYRIFNSGSKKCILQSPEIGLDAPVEIQTGEIVDRQRPSEVGAKVTPAVVEVYVGTQPAALSKTKIHVLSSVQ
jgi:hypothetical protein